MFLCLLFEYSLFSSRIMTFFVVRKRTLPYMISNIMRISKNVHPQSQKSCCEHIWSKIANFFQKKKKIVSPHFFTKVFCAENPKKKVKTSPIFYDFIC